MGGGCESGQTAINNRAYFNTIAFKMRVLRPGDADTTCHFFERRLQTPIMSGAMSHMKNLADAPLQKVAQGLKAAGALMWVGICPNDELASVAEVGVPFVKIAKPYADSGKIIERIGFAEDLGAVAVGIDVSFFYGSKKKSRFFTPEPMSPKTLDELKDVMSTVTVPFVFKGILSGEDAKRANEAGGKVIVVSNHGASVLDHAAHPLQVLPEVVQAIEGEVEVLVDSGFRRGTDVLKGLALGARGVLMGINTLMGLAANGADGVRDMFIAVTNELQRAMRLTGCADLNEITNAILVY
jgi:isopentenyl diphosphate isomerase/L-lactate dehydrogenase-like FMN-dependent dehydrogenase